MSCVGKCKLDKPSQKCLGCERTMSDIRQAYKEFLTRQAESDIIVS